jgi:hypothetical protein
LFLTWRFSGDVDQFKFVDRQLPQMSLENSVSIRYTDLFRRNPLEPFYLASIVFVFPRLLEEKLPVQLLKK